MRCLCELGKYVECVSQATGSENKRLDTAGRQCKTHGPTQRFQGQQQRKGDPRQGSGRVDGPQPSPHCPVCSEPGVTLPGQLARSPRGRQRWRTVGLLRRPLRLGWA